MTELGGVLPDPALRVKALDKITRAVFQTHPEAAFRVNLTRAALQIDSTPDGEKVIQLHAQMLAELESLTHRSVPKEGDKAREGSQTANPKVKGVETSDVPSPPKNPKPGRGTPKQNSAPKATGNDAAGSGGSTVLVLHQSDWLQERCRLHLCPQLVCIFPGRASISMQDVRGQNAQIQRVSCGGKRGRES